MPLPSVALCSEATGGLFLALIAVTVYYLRQQLALLYWALAWLCGVIWLLFWGWTIQVPGGADAGLSPWPRDLAFLAAGCHIALFVLGLQLFQRGRRETLAWASSPPRPPASPSAWLRSAVAVLLAAGVGWAVARALPPRAGDLAAPLACSVLYGWSALLLLRGSRREAAPGTPPVMARAPDRATRAREVDRGVWLFGVGLALAATRQVCQVIRGVEIWSAGAFIPEASWPYLAGLICEAMLAAGLIVLLRDDLKDTLDETLRRLNEAETHFRLVFEHSGVGMALLTPVGRFMRVKQALERLLGYKAAELRDRRLVDFAHPEDTRHGLSRSEQGLEVPSDLYEKEKRYRHKNGQTIWARLLRVPLRTEGGEIRCLVAVLLDIIEKRQAQDALAASEELYRMRFQGSFDGIFCCKEGGEFLETNPSFCRMLGYADKEIQGLTLADVAGDLPQVRHHFRTVIDHGGHRVETRLRRKDGSTVEVELSSAQLTLHSQRVVHSISRDITARKEGEEALRRSEETLREVRDFCTQVLETADALILVLDSQGRIVRFNGKCTAVTGYREEEVRGRVFWEFLLPPHYAEVAQANFSRALTERVPLGFDAPLLTRAGEERWITWRNTTVADAQGRLRYVIDAGLDVTEHRRLETQLRQAQKMETLGTLVGGIAHDFNNQLTAILGNLELLLADVPPNHVHRSLLADAHRAGRHCADMTQGLLTFSRQRIGQMQPTYLNKVLADAMRLLQRVLPAPIRMDLQGHLDLWSVNADQTQMHQLVMNLAINARDAMPEGGTLTFKTLNRMVDNAYCARNVEARVGPAVVLSVSDTGTGMTPEVLSRIFEPFFTTKPVGQGTGLGLAIVFGIVKAHGGWVAVSSTPGRGSTFEVFLPRGEAKLLAEPGDSQTKVCGGHERILVVDDEDMVRNLAQAVLIRWGYRVLTASNGEEALSLYHSHGHEIDLVLLDYTMPGMNGLQVLHMLQALNPDVRVIFSSGLSAQSDSERLLDGGARAFVAKPYRVEELVRRVRQVLDERSSEDSFLDPMEN